MITSVCRCGIPIEDPTNLTRECSVCNVADGSPALRANPCDICGEQIKTLRLIKWRENGQVIRYWVCYNCWRRIYPADV